MLLRSGVFKLGRPFVGVFLKVAWFVRLADWVGRNREIGFNDFPASPAYGKRYELYEYVLKTYMDGGERPFAYFEFGVADGETFGWWLKRVGHADARFYGFDTFSGLPEDWGIHKKGAFSNDGVIPVFADKRHRFYQGLFQATVPGFLTDYSSGLPKVILLDADLYSSTLYVLTALAPMLRTGDILLFDEFFAPQHEFRAFMDFQQAYPMIRLRMIGAANNYEFTAFRVDLVRDVPA